MAGSRNRAAARVSARPCADAGRPAAGAFAAGARANVAGRHGTAVGRLAASAGLVQTSRMIRRCLPIASALALALFLTACGFHLRNALVLPPDLGSIRVQSTDPYSSLADSLSHSIERAGARMAADDDTEATVLDLLSERWGDTPISIDQLGRAQEYSLRYAVVFEVRKADGSKPVPRQAVELSRDYISNPVNSIGTEGERELLARELRREMAASIIRRLDAVARTPDGAPAPASRLDDPIAEDAARAALEAADANPPPDEPMPEQPAPETAPEASPELQPEPPVPAPAPAGPSEAR